MRIMVKLLGGGTLGSFQGAVTVLVPGLGANCTCVFTLRKDMRLFVLFSICMLHSIKSKA